MLAGGEGEERQSVKKRVYLSTADQSKGKKQV